MYVPGTKLFVIVEYIMCVMYFMKYVNTDKFVN